jgi:hypothetical protein
MSSPQVSWAQIWKTLRPTWLFMLQPGQKQLSNSKLSKENLRQLFRESQELMLQETASPSAVSDETSPIFSRMLSNSNFKIKLSLLFRTR